MDNWVIVIAKLEQMVRSESVERIEWYKKRSEIKLERSEVK